MKETPGVLGVAGELALRPDVRGKSQPTPNHKLTRNFVEKHCRSDVREEWNTPSVERISKLRAILNALQEEKQATQILKKASENDEAKRKLDLTRASVDKRLARCKLKEEHFNMKREEFRKHVLENEKSWRELDSNIDKWERKVREEQAERRRLEIEIRVLEAELSENEKAREVEQRKIARTVQYKGFLEAVVESAEEFEGDIEILIGRYNTLERSNAELHQANTTRLRELDGLREEVTRTQTKLENERLMISSQLDECQLSLDRVRDENKDLEAKLNGALTDRDLKESQIGVIENAIDQLFGRAVASCRLPTRLKQMQESVNVKYAPVRGERSDVRLEAMLEQIIERLGDMRDIYCEASAKLKTNKPVLRTFEPEPMEVKFEYVAGGQDLPGRLATSSSKRTLTSSSAQNTSG